MGSLLGSLLGAGKAVQSPGPPPVPGASGMTSVPGSSTGASPDLALIRAYKHNGTVHSNVSLLGSSVAGPAWNLYRSAGPSQRYSTSDRGSDERKQVTVHAALNVLNRPASILVPSSGRRWPVWDRFGLFEISDIWMELTGKSHWVVDFAEGASKIPLGLWPVRPDRIVPVPDRNNYLAGWVYRPPDGGALIPLYPDEVIYNRYPDPEDVYGGCGPIRSVITDIQSADYAAEWQKNYFVNSAEPGGIIQLDQTLDDEEFNQFVSRWRETHRGVARAHRIAVLEAGATWVANNHSPRDMDFFNLRNVMRDTIREAMGMHKVMTGVTDDVNRANAQTGEEVFASWKVEPRLIRWRNVLNSQFLPLFGETACDLEFDFVLPMPRNREQDNAELTAKVQGLLTLVTAGADWDDACATVGLPKMKARELATQMPALPPGWVPGQDGAPDAVAAAEAILRAAAARDPRAMAIWNSMAGAR